MTDSPDWLPPLVLFGDFNGNWNCYLEAIYSCFKQDFIDSRPIFQGRQIDLKSCPLVDGKDTTFWHMIQEGEIEDERTPDFRRCERIRWPRSIIEHDSDSHIKVWQNLRGREIRTCLWFTLENYLVVLAHRGRYVLLWTAYIVEQPHRQRKLQKEYEEYRRGRA